MSAATLPTVGTTAEPLTHHLDAGMLVAYGGATWDWNRIHHDGAYAAERGLPAPIVDGQMFGAFLAHHAMAIAGSSAFPTTMSFKFRGMVFVGDTVTVTGEVADLDEATNTYTVTQEIHAVTDVGDEPRLAVVGTTKVGLR